jgi:hypothetical protein
MPEDGTQTAGKKKRNYPQIMCQKKKRQSSAFGREFFSHNRYLKRGSPEKGKDTGGANGRNKQERLKTLPCRG